MLSANDIREAVSSNDTARITAVYSQLFPDTIDWRCGDCISDAKSRLQIKANQLDREHTPVIIYINVYSEKNPKRQKELDECLWQHHNSPFVNKVVEIKGRPTYNEFFEMFDKDAINVIVNSDIFFDETLRLVKQIKPNQCYALTRYDWNGNGHARFFSRIDSQDAWIFRGRLKKQVYGDFCLGVPGCDNRIAYELKKVGYQVINPSLSIHALHYHTSSLRHYDSKTPVVPQPYHFVRPQGLV